MSKLSELRDSKKQAKRQPPRSLLEQIRDSVMSGVNGYVARQGRLANDGLNWANQGFDRVRGGDPLGLLDELGGATSYLASPVAALVPTRDEIAASQLPEWAKPFMSGVSQGALVALPGPDLGPAASAAGRTARGVGEQAQMYADDFAQRFGVDVPAGVEVYGAGPVLRKPGQMPSILENTTIGQRGLGRGLSDLVGDATDAELAALKARIDAEMNPRGPGTSGPPGILSNMPGRIRGQ